MIDQPPPRPEADLLLLVAHGSRRTAWRQPIEALRERLAAHLGGEAVRLANLELCPPTIATAIEEAVAAGASRIRVLPLFISGGGHVQADVAPQVEAAAVAYPGVSVEILPALGEHPVVIEAVCAIARGATSSP